MGHVSPDSFKQGVSAEASRAAAVPSAQRWDARRFLAEQKLQDANRNEGAVFLMRDMEAGGCFVAVKQMPLTWTQADVASFDKKHPSSSERPWLDIAVVAELNEKGCAFACKFIGVFLDNTFLYVVSSLANGGDLFDWCGAVVEPVGLEREQIIQPVVKQLASAVRALHEHGICHRDISMENVLLHREEADGPFRVKLIDFGMATQSRYRRHEPRGKYSYQAPEMHVQDGEYDGFLSDAFAVGVTAFCIAAKDYPWRSTEPKQCMVFDYVAKSGHDEWFAKRKPPGCQGKSLAECFSLPLSQLIKGLLDFEPSSRLTLGERSWRFDASCMRQSVWDVGWLGDDLEYASQAVKSPTVQHSTRCCADLSLSPLDSTRVNSPSEENVSIPDLMRGTSKTSAAGSAGQRQATGQDAVDLLDMRPPRKMQLRENAPEFDSPAFPS